MPNHTGESPVKSRKRKMNKKVHFKVWQGFLAVLMLSAALFAVVPAVHAAEIDNGGIIKAGETINDDLILSGESVQMDGTVNGLLLAAGSTVTIDGIVNGDVIAAGRTVVITDNARIDGNLFTGAQNIVMNGVITGSLFGGSTTMDLGEKSSIDRNVYYGGYSLMQAAGSKTTRDTRAGVYQARLAGETGQDAVVYGGAVEVSGKIGRNADFMVEDPSVQNEPINPFMSNMGITTNLKPGLRVDSTASIGGKMTYTSKAEQSNAIKSSPAGGIVFQTPVPSKSGNKTSDSSPQAVQTVGLLSGLAGFASNLISLLLVGALILWKAPALLNENTDMVKDKPWVSAGMGFVTILVGYVGAFLAIFIVILIGIILGFISFGGLLGVSITLGLSLLAAAFAIFSLAVTLVSKVIIAYLAGKWLYSKLAPNQSNVVWPLVIGVLMYAILRAIPFFGILVGVVVTLIGVGAMWLVYRARTSPEGSSIQQSQSAG
jgi:cytoskeletal protein CcmA (bactofilin family)